MKTALTLCTLLLALISVAPGQALLVEDFQYTLGDTLGGPWVRHSGTKPDTILAGLTYPGYPGSGIGNSVQIANGNDADYNRKFTAQTSGSVYTSFMVNVKNASSTGKDYFIHYMEDVSTTNIRGRVFCQKNAGDSVAFGLSFSNEPSIPTPYDYSLNTTYLFVLKTTIGSGTNDDSVGLYIFKEPTMPGTEPATAVVGPLGNAAATDLVNIGAIGLRQGAANTPTLRVDGIRVAKTWSPLVTSVEQVASDNRPTAFMLHDNFPNPFNPTTVISYQLSAGSFVTLKVFDLLGKEVATLVNEAQEAGHYQTRFDASRLSSGTYLYRLVAGSYVSTKRMLLMK